MSTLSQRLDRIRAENPKLSQYVNALADYIYRLRLRGQKEFEPHLASQALHTTEAFALGLFKLFEDAGLLKHSYNIYCAKQRAFLASVPEKEDIPSVISCKFCDAEHCDPEDFEVELVFTSDDSVWQSLSQNVATH